VSDCLISVGNRKSELGDLWQRSVLQGMREQGHLLLSCNLIFPSHWRDCQRAAVEHLNRRSDLVTLAMVPKRINAAYPMSEWRFGDEASSVP
jgi:hypothetical protein